MRALLCLLLPLQAAGIGRVVKLLHGVFDTTPNNFCERGSRGFQERVEQHASQLPTRAHLFIGTWDRSKLKNIWWKWKEVGGLPRYDLFVRFNLTYCPSFILLPAVKKVEPLEDGIFPSMAAPALRWEGKVGELSTWQEWARHSLRRDVTIKNSLSLDLNVSFMLSFEERLTEVLLAGTTRSFSAWLGSKMHARLYNGSLFWEHVVIDDGSESCKQVEITDVRDPVEVQRLRKSLEDLDKAYNKRDQDTTFRHMSNVRQPPVMPVFYDKASQPIKAYKLVDTPPEILDRIRRFYKDHRPDADVEGLSNDSTGINVAEVQTGIVSYEKDRKEKNLLVNAIRPYVEEWANMNLTFTSLYGVREYYRGAELRNHVDRVSTHVFSAIIQVERGHMDEEWPLEVYDFDGTVKEVKMGNGQMLFYQSAKLIHGRPKPLKGEFYANVFCHFSPAAGWEFKLMPGDQLFRDGKPFISYLTTED